LLLPVGSNDRVLARNLVLVLLVTEPDVAQPRDQPVLLGGSYGPRELLLVSLQVAVKQPLEQFRRYARVVVVLIVVPALHVDRRRVARKRGFLQVDAGGVEFSVSPSSFVRCSSR